MWRCLAWPNVDSDELITARTHGPRLVADADPVAGARIIGMDGRPLTQRERAVLEALLAVDFQGVETLRSQAADVVVVGTCGCGCPSIDFNHGRGLGMAIQVNASVPDSHDGLFLYTIEEPQRGEVLLLDVVLRR